MSKKKVAEIVIYIVVALTFLIGLPVLAKFLDKIVFNSSYCFAQNSILIYCGIFVFFCGGMLGFRVVYLFKKIGKGTPNPKFPPTILITDGPFKYVRNPMALSGTIILFGQSMIYYSYFMLFFSIIYTITIYFNAMLVEEPELKKRYGKPYEEYLLKVHRLFPHM
jgi:protein-S-isoprenylcysteine O-methyltransferase Ste14